MKNFALEDKTAVLVDGTAFYAMSKAFHVRINYDKLREWFNDLTTVTRWRYHASVTTNAEGESKMRPFLDWLNHNGWPVVETEAQRIDNSQRIKAFTDWIKTNNWPVNEHVAMRTFDDLNVTAVLDHDVSMSVSASIASLIASGNIEQIVLIGANPRYAEILAVARSREINVVLLTSFDMLPARQARAMADEVIDLRTVIDEFADYPPEARVFEKEPKRVIELA